MSPAAPLYVLIGGRSQRFGSDKASHLVDGQPWALHVASALSPDAGATLVGAAPANPEYANARMIGDVLVGGESRGPLSGVAAALRDRQERCGPGELIIASCDLYRPERAWIGELRNRILNDPEAEVAAFRSSSGWCPFPCAAHTRWLKRVAAALEGADRSVQGLLNRSRAVAIPIEDSDRLAASINTPNELAEQVRRCRA